MSGFDYKKYLAKGGIEAKLQENPVNEESIDEGVFDGVGKIIKDILTDLQVALIIPFDSTFSHRDIIERNRTKALMKVTNRLKNDPEIMEYVNNPSKKGLRKAVLSKLTDQEKIDIGTYVKNSLSRGDLDY
jgi:hypothetical protein